VVILGGLAAWAGPDHDLASHAANGRMSDIGLYRAVARQVGQGADYYASAVELQRANGFPLHPFVTVRLPTLAWALGHLGTTTALALAGALIAANAIIWFGAFPFTRPAERVCIVALVLLGSIMAPQAVYLHEWWAGQLLTAALGLFLRNRSGAGLALAIAALFVRELSALFIAVSLPFLLHQRRRRDVVAALIALSAFAIALALHRAKVAALVLPTDLTSPGWLGLRGPAGPSGDLEAMVLFGLVPEPLASLLVFAPLLGWAETAMRRTALPLVWFAGFLGVLALLARADNGFWVRMILPGYMAGLALVPRAIMALAQPGSHGRPHPVAEQQVHLP
jgi:hypothetical protein